MSNNPEAIRQKADEWVRHHKNQFAKKLILDSGAKKSDSPASIFTAGLPGSGKTEFIKGWLTASGIKVVYLDMDEIATHIDMYSAENADIFRKPASALLSRTYDKVINGNYDFVMDGTFGGSAAIKDVERALSHGYSVKIIYIHQDPKIAWQYTVAREKIEHRAIDIDGFIESYYRTLRNLKRLNQLPLSSISIDLVLKDAQNIVRETICDISIKEIEKIIHIEHDRHKLKEKIYA